MQDNRTLLAHQLRLIRVTLSDRFNIKMSDLTGMLLRAKKNNQISDADYDEVSRLNDLCSEDKLITDNDIRSAQYLIENIKKDKGQSKLFEYFEKLSLKSKEALVSGNYSLDEFHEYLHISRPIETELENVFTSIIPKNRQTLTLIVGNVGDGKSHLLAYEKSKNADIFAKYNIDVHNDATESISPKMTAIDTLMKKMAVFDGTATEDRHLIVAINMGILVKFANTARKAARFSELISFLDQTGILQDANATSQISDKFQLITFRESPNFEFDQNGVHSSFIRGLIAKVVAQTPENPFYQAYQHDKQYALTPEIVNYELLSNRNVQLSLEKLLIRVQIVYGQMLSARQILNFIHDVVVPPDGTDNYRAWLPMLLFNGENRSNVLRFVARLDPILNQNAAIDSLNSRLFNTLQFTEEVKEIFAVMGLNQEFADYEQMINHFSDFSEQNDDSQLWGKATNFVLRLLSLLAPDHPAFRDPAYEQFTRVLAATERNGDEKTIVEFERKVQTGLVKWNGIVPEKNYTFTNAVDQNIAVEVKARINTRESVKRLGTHVVLEATFADKGEFEPVDIDFQIYKLLTQVVAGFTLRKLDIQNAVDFDHYVQQLIAKCDSDSVLVRVLNTNKFIKIFDEGFGCEAEEIK